MKTIFTILVLVFFSLISSAQNPGKVVEVIKGVVIDAETSEPVSYTNIGLEGTFYGTASNGEGKFELKIPEEFKNKNIYFSAVGFQNKKFPVRTLFGNEFNLIKIEPQSYGIEDIDVAAQSKVLVRILTLANERIPYNYIAGPYNLEAVYTCKRTTNDTEVEEQKADVLIYDQSGYVRPSKKDAFQNLKYSMEKVKWDNSSTFTAGSANLDDMLELDWVRTASSVLNKGLLDGFELKLKDEPTVNGKPCWVISFQQKEPTPAGSGNFYAAKFDGEITVVKEDYSVIKIEGEIQSPKNSQQGNSLAIGKNVSAYLENVKSNFSVEYAKQKPLKIMLVNSFRLNGKNINEISSLIFEQARANNLTEIENRDYYIGE